MFEVAFDATRSPQEKLRKSDFISVRSNALTSAVTTDLLIR